MINTSKPLGLRASNMKKRVVAKLATTFKVKPRFSSNQSPDDVADSLEACSFDSRGRISEVVQNVKDASTLTTAMANIGLQPPTDNVQASEPTTDAVSSAEDGPSTTIATPASAIGNTASADVIDDAQASSPPIPSTTTTSTTTTTPCIVKPVPVTPVPYSVFQEGCKIAADQLRDRASPRRDTRRYSPLSSRSGKTTTRDRVRAIRGLSDDESDDSASSVRSPSPKHALGHLLNEQDIAPVSREASPSPAYAAIAAAAAAAQPEAVDEATHHEAARAELADDEGDQSSDEETKVATARTARLEPRRLRQKASAVARKLDYGSRRAVQKRKKATARRPVIKNFHPPACFLRALYYKRVAEGTATEEDRKYVEQQEREQYAAMSDEEEESEEERCEEEARGVAGERMDEEESDEEQSEMEEVLGADDSLVVCPSLSPASFSDDEEMDSSEDEFLGPLPGYVDFGHGDAAYPTFSYLAPGEYAKGGYGTWEAREDTYMGGEYTYTNGDYTYANNGMDSCDRGDFEEDAAMDDADGEAGYAAAAGGKYAAYQPMLVGPGAMYGGWCGAAIELA